jgi:hypothetical protein
VAEYELALNDQPLAHRPLEINSTINQDIIDGSSGLDSFTTRVSGMVCEGATWMINAPRVIRRLLQSGVAIPRAHHLGRALTSHGAPSCLAMASR